MVGIGGSGWGGFGPEDEWWGQFPTGYPVFQCVGWVERSETHRFVTAPLNRDTLVSARSMDFAALYPSYG